jgi:hypothetical protein
MSMYFVALAPFSGDVISAFIGRSEHGPDSRPRG